MKMKPTISLMVAAMLSASFLTFAANHYVRQGASGAGNGSDWPNAWTDMPTTWIRGDTYYVAGGTYSGRNYNTPVSGTAMITIKGATASDHGSEIGWNPTYGVDVNQAHFAPSTVGPGSTGYWIFDGNCGNGTAASSYGFVMDHPASGTHHAWTFGGMTNGSISNIQLSHFYATTAAGDHESYFHYTYGLLGAFSDCVFSYNYTTGFQEFVTAQGATLSGNSPNITCEYNYVMHGYSSPTHHGEDLNANIGSSFTNLIIRYNVFQRDGGTAVICANNNNIYNSYIYGNIFVDCTTGNGIIAGTSSGYLQKVFVYNNTFIRCSSGGWVVGGTGNPSGNVAYNNLLYDMDATVGSGIALHDYNAFFRTTNTPLEAHIQTGSSSPFVDANMDYHLTAETSTGLSLPSPFDADMDRATRGVGAWDRGAYEYTPASGGSTPPAPPKKLRLAP